MESRKLVNKILILLSGLILVALLSVTIYPTGDGSTRSTSVYQSYIVQGMDVAQVAELVKAYGGEVTSYLDIINGVAAVLSEQAISRLQREAGITAITPNALVMSTGRVRVPSTDYPDVVGADEVWESGVTGEGVSVAVLDTGLAIHKGIFKGLDDKVRDRIVGWVDFVDGRRLPRDPNGHGSHIAGIIANTEVGADGEWNGVAPGVSLVGVRVLNEYGFGTYEQVINGIQWVIRHKDDKNIKVMNLSLVAPVQSPYWADPLNQATMRAWAEGITVVVAAGNGGPDPMTVGVPGNNPYVVTVGAFTDNYTPMDWSDDYIAPFSAAGPTLDGFVKPDVVAPGAHMVSTMIPSSYIAKTHQANRVIANYFSMAGTSQAAAVVSGIAALVHAYNPDITPDEVKYRIQITAFPWVNLDTELAVYSIWQQGAGRVNAVDATLADIDGTANLGLNIWDDLAGVSHYEGYSYYDEVTGEFRLRGEFESWAGGYGAWAGGYGAWAGGYGAWAGGYGAWAGGYGAWAGGYGAWAGGYGAWAGGYGAWAGGYGAWAGSEPWAETIFSEIPFINDYLAGVGPDAASTTTSILEWVEEP